MKVRKLHKQRLKHIPRASYHQNIERQRPRNDATYFSDYCCQGCYFDWGRFFDKQFMYQHNCAKDNYSGKLKKYWVSPDDYAGD